MPTFKRGDAGMKMETPKGVTLKVVEVDEQRKEGSSTALEANDFKPDPGAKGVVGKLHWGYLELST